MVGALMQKMVCRDTQSNINGPCLPSHAGRSERYSLANPLICDDTSITANGVLGVNYDYVDSEHPEDRSIFPNHFARFAQTGELWIYH
jgi:hypothetical protein